MKRPALVSAGVRRRLGDRLHRSLFLLLESRPMIVGGDERRVIVDPTAVVADALFNVASGTITVGSHAFFGHRVMLLTGTHDVSTANLDRQRAIPDSGRDITVGPGAWIASGAIVLGPCVIGANAVVAAGAVVRSDVPAGATVGGVPARLLS